LNCLPSSKSEKRFLVNFQIKKAMRPMTATPPATDRPMIEPVLKPPPLVSDWGGADCVGWEEEVEEEGPTTVTTVVTKVPSTEVITGVVTVGVEVVDVSGVEEVDGVVEILVAEDVWEVVADEEVGEEDVAVEDVGVVDIGVVAVVIVFGSGKSWAFVLIEKRRSTRTKVFMRWSWKRRSN
jgi:hypothetical protein